MARSKRTHPDDVKLALCSSIEDDGMTYKQAVEALAAGELADAPAYDFPLNQVGRYLSDFRKRRVMSTLHPQTAQAETEFVDEQYRKARSRLLRLGERIDKRIAKGDLSLELEARLVREHALAAKAVHAIAPKPPPRGRTKQPEQEPPQEIRTLQRIMANATKHVEEGEQGTEGEPTEGEASTENGVSGRVPSLDAAAADHAPVPVSSPDPGPAVAQPVA